MSRETGKIPYAVIIEKDYDYTQPVDPKDQPELPPHHVGYHQFEIHESMKEWYRRQEMYVATLTNPLDPYEMAAIALPIVQPPEQPFAHAYFRSNLLDRWVREHISHLIAPSIAQGKPDIVMTLPRSQLLGDKLAQLLSVETVPIDNFIEPWHELDETNTNGTTTQVYQPYPLVLNPLVFDRVRDKRVVIIDDVIHTGGDMSRAIRQARKANPLDILVATVFTQTDRWQKKLDDISFNWENHLFSLGELPLLEQERDGLWYPQQITTE